MTAVGGGARLVMLLAACAACFGADHAIAADTAQVADSDPPDRVARINLLDGTAAVEPAGAEDWGSAVVNLPLTSGDKIWVDANSRAELHLGSIAIRLADRTAVQFLSVADHAVQLEISAGTLNVRLRYLSPDETFEIDTPNVAVALVEPGEYRVDVDDSGDVTDVGVLSGQAEVSSPTQAFTLRYRQQGHFAGSESVIPGFDDRAPPDEFDQWAAARDDREDRALAANYVSRDETGYEDLDGNGEWQTEAETGPVWVPRVDSSWAPYQTGYWVWISPWGWTWVDAAPWGFAPFHYGRWIHLKRGWAWSPGAIAVRPTYAPAVVAWVGGTAGVAWCALGYDEIYRPPYRASGRYLRDVNVTNTHLGNTTLFDAGHAGAKERYVNQQVPGAVGVVSREVFVAGLPVNQHLEHVDAGMLAGAAAGTALLSIAPNAQSFIHDRNGGAARRPPSGLFTRGIVARTPPPPQPVPLEAQRRAIIAHGSRPVPLAYLARRELSARIVRPAMIRSIALAPAESSSPQGTQQRQSAQREAVTRQNAPQPAAAQPSPPRLEPRDAGAESTSPRPTPRPAPSSPVRQPALSPKTDRPPEHAADRPPPPGGEPPLGHRPDRATPEAAEPAARPPKRPDTGAEGRAKPQLRQ